MNFEKYRALNDNPSRLGIMENPDAIGVFSNDGCGDNYEIYIKVDNNIVTDALFKTTGCGFGLAALQLTLECSVGRSVEDAKNIPDADIEAGIDGFPPGRAHYIKEAKEALVDALNKLPA